MSTTPKKSRSEMIEEAAAEFVRGDECEVMDDYSAHEDTFIAGANYADSMLHEHPSVVELLTALEMYAMTNETFPEYGDVAREALKNLKNRSEG